MSNTANKTLIVKPSPMVKRIFYKNSDFTYRAMLVAEYDIVCLAARTKLPNMDSDDIAQELRLRLFLQLHHFNPLKSSFRTWMIKVLKNHLNNLYRDSSTTYKRKANLNLAPLESWLEVDKSAVKDLNVMMAMRKLPNLEKAVIFCLFFKNMTLKATAEKLKRTQKEIKAIKEVAKSQLKLLLA